MFGCGPKDLGSIQFFGKPLVETPIAEKFPVGPYLTNI